MEISDFLFSGLAKLETKNASPNKKSWAKIDGVGQASKATIRMIVCVSYSEAGSVSCSVSSIC